MKQLLISVILFWSMTSWAQVTLTDSLPPRVGDYILSYPGHVDDSFELYRVQHIIYTRAGGDSYEDNIFIAFHIYNEEDTYQQDLKQFSFDDLMGEIESLSFPEPNELTNLLGSIEGKSDEEVMEEDMDYQYIDDPRFVKAWYKEAKNIGGHHTFRAALYWGDKQYAEVKARNETGDLSVETLLMFIRDFPFETL